MGNFLITWDPLLPLLVLAGMAALGILVLGMGLLAPRPGRPAPGLALRALAVTGILGTLANPSLVLEDREALSDIGLIIVDRSPSQSIGERTAQTERALSEVRAWADTQSNLELRVIDAPRVSSDTDQPSAGLRDGSHLFTALEHALADVPRERFSGAMLITDGRIHDVPEDAAKLNMTAPIHALVTGARDVGDRRLTIVQSPGFGIVGDEVRLTLRIDEPRATQARQAQITIRRDGEIRGRTTLVPVGVDHSIDMIVDRGGPSVFEITVGEGTQELTLTNNRAVVTINGIRDRLRVLLVSGAPHPGERTWRNLLKADPSVDLVHFTILRPPDKQDGTPVRELSLIAFPYRELFEIKLNDFDLIIFDRYQRMGILPSVYLRNIANYVQSGGALLEATGPEITPAASLYRTALAAVLPGEPTGDLIESPFTADVNETGRRHPVTAHLTGLPADPGDTPNWGRWFRQIDARPKSGTVVMEGANERPLLILDRVGEGRVGQFLSDHIWLWARGYEGGGPHNELLRRLAHWLMKEPELEEDRLTTFVRGDTIEITRRSLKPDLAPVFVTSPTGEESQIVLDELGDGRASGQIAVSAPGIYHFDDGTRTTVAGVGTINPIEFADVTSTDLLLRPATTATGGGVTWLSETGVPDLRRNRVGRAQADTPSSGVSARWLAFQRNDASAIRGVQNVPFLPALLLLILIGAMLVGAWRRESR
ncbi:MAG: hypothetical protein HOJ90_15180 [Alphaproteobacteria bacterium]|jgi:uncharacterized membrane protein|nr:hypothetical protein [Alphaproteobacteria bacterium]